MELPEQPVVGGAVPKFLPIPAERVIEAAKSAVGIMFPDLKVERVAEITNHVVVLLIAVGIMEERGRKYAPYGWMKRGYEHNYFHLQNKVDRIKEAIVDRFPDRAALSLDQLDDAVDAINYAAFLIRNATDGNKSGKKEERPSSGRATLKARR